MKELLNFKMKNYDTPFRNEPLKSNLSFFCQNYFIKKDVHAVVGFDQDGDIVFFLEDDRAYCLLIETSRKIEISIYRFNEVDGFHYEDACQLTDIKTAKKNFLSNLNLCLDSIIRHHIDSMIGQEQELVIVAA